MNWRITSCSLLLLAGCASGGTSGPAGGVLKISYYRSNLDPKTKKRVPTYRVVMSESWKKEVGESPREPFGRAAPGMVYVGFVPDGHMGRYLEALRKAGLEQLAPREPESFTPQDLHRLASHPEQGEYMRIITVGTDAWHKSYFYKDQQVSPEQINRFRECEKIVSVIAEYSFQFRTGVQPFSPDDRR